jgi:hypothetical protein
VSGEQRIPLSGTSTQFGDSNEQLPDLNGAPEEIAGIHGRRRRPVWLHRLGVLLFVFFCALVGMVLIIFPWREEWTGNTFLYGHPALQDFISNGFVRGICSGLGVLDIWIGFWEAVHYRE